MFGANDTIQASSTLKTPDWTDLQGQASMVGFELILTNATDAGSRFYRLRAPSPVTE
jgi:hypothetical protein